MREHEPCRAGGDQDEFTHHAHPRQPVLVSCIDDVGQLHLVGGEPDVADDDVGGAEHDVRTVPQRREGRLLDPLPPAGAGLGGVQAVSDLLPEVRVARAEWLAWLSQPVPPRGSSGWRARSSPDGRSAVAVGEIVSARLDGRIAAGPPLDRDVLPLDRDGPVLRCGILA